MHDTTQTEATPRTTRVLLVDDNEELRELLGGYLTRFNIASEAVGNGAAMRLALAGGHFDAVILDLMLP
ncbi:response regulator, partial [Bowmanella sp. Y57]